MKMYELIFLLFCPLLIVQVKIPLKNELFPRVQNGIYNNDSFGS